MGFLEWLARQFDDEEMEDKCPICATPDLIYAGPFGPDSSGWWCRNSNCSYHRHCYITGN